MKGWNQKHILKSLEKQHYHFGTAAFHPYTDSGLRSRSDIQKREDDVSWPVDNPPQKTKVDGGSGPFYRITVTLRTSDDRDRDADGADSTLLDTYLFAVGRLLGLDRVDLRKLAKSEERRRRGRHNH